MGREVHGCKAPLLWFLVFFFGFERRRLFDMAKEYSSDKLIISKCSVKRLFSMQPRACVVLNISPPFLEAVSGEFEIYSKQSLDKYCRQHSFNGDYEQSKSTQNKVTCFQKPGKSRVTNESRHYVTSTSWSCKAQTLGFPSRQGTLD